MYNEPESGFEKGGTTAHLSRENRQIFVSAQ